MTGVTRVPDQAVQHRPLQHRQATHDGLALAIAVASLAGFVLLTVAIMSGVVFPFDQPLLRIIHGWDGTPIVWKVISESANIPLIVIGLGFVGWLFFTGRRREALLVLLMLAAVTAGSEGVKQLVARPRPDTGTADGIPGVVYSYPSGHVLEAMTILGFVTIRLWRSGRSLTLRRTVAILVVIDVVLVAIARMALNAHYPTDILAGLFGATTALGLYIWFTRPGAWADHPPRAGGEPGGEPGGRADPDPPVSGAA